MENSLYVGQKGHRTVEQILKIGISLKFTSVFLCWSLCYYKDKLNRLYLFKIMLQSLVLFNWIYFALNILTSNHQPVESIWSNTSHSNVMTKATLKISTLQINCWLVFNCIHYLGHFEFVIRATKSFFLSFVLSVSKTFANEYLWATW